MKQRFKRQLLTQNKCINSIMRFYNAASVEEIKEGMNWYNEANDYCKDLASRFNINISQIAGIIAAFSPQTGWEENKRYALSFLLNTSYSGRSAVTIQKVKHILTLKTEGEIYAALSINNEAWKTKAFFLNILNPKMITDVTIDRHAIAVCLQSINKTEPLNKNYAKLTVIQYRFFEKCYASAALKLNILPQQLQAIVWTVYRRLRDLRQYNDIVKQWQPFDNSEKNPF